MDLLTSSQIVHCFCVSGISRVICCQRKKNSVFFPTRHRPKMIYKNYYLDESVVVAYFDPTELNGNWPVRRIIIVLSALLCHKGTQRWKFVSLNPWYRRKFEIHQHLYFKTQVLIADQEMGLFQRLQKAGFLAAGFQTAFYRLSAISRKSADFHGNFTSVFQKWGEILVF